MAEGTFPASASGGGLTDAELRASSVGVVLTTGAAVIGSLVAHQSIDLTRIAGTATAVSSGSLSNGVQRVAIATDDVNLAAINTATAAASAKLPATLGQKAMAASLAVVLASDQSSIPVTGTFWQATQPVSGTVAFSNTTIAVTNAGTFAVQIAANSTVDLNRVAGTAVDTNSGTKSAGSQRVVIATDDINLAAINTSTSGMSAKLPATLGQKTMANSMAVVLASDQTVIPVSDNSGSLTVDAPVATPVFVRLSDGAAAISTLPVSLASVPSHAVTNAGTFAVQDSQAVTDNAAFTDGTTKLFMSGFVYDETAGTTALTENDAAAARVNLNRAVVGTIEDGVRRGYYAKVTDQRSLQVALDPNQTLPVRISDPIQFDGSTLELKGAVAVKAPRVSSLCYPVASSTSSTVIAQSQGQRATLSVFNSSTSEMYVKQGPDASTTSFTAKIAAGGYWEMPVSIHGVYNGVVTGVWDTVNGTAQVTDTV